MDPWYKVATPRKEVREGRSFNPDEFAIALEQVVAGKAPGGLSGSRKVLLAHLLYAGAQRACRHGPSAPRREN
jgi:hypothetical protein